MLCMVVARARLVAREEARQRLRRLGPVDHRDDDQHDPGEDRERDEQTVVPHPPEHTARFGRPAGVTKALPTVNHDFRNAVGPMATRLHPDAAPQALLNRELSALELNARVLDLAADPNEPLLERVKFCGIVSSILDEFFMVRVAGLLDQLASGLSVRSPDGRTPPQTLAEIRTRVLALTASQSRL